MSITGELISIIIFSCLFDGILISEIVDILSIKKKIVKIQICLRTIMYILQNANLLDPSFKY